MKPWTVRVVALALIIAGAGGAAWHFLGPVAVEAESPRRGPAVEAVYGPGTVEPVVMLPIEAKSVGRLSRLHVKEGDRVRADQPLAQLDERELAASVSEWEARLRYAEAQFKRADDLFHSRTGSEAARDQARNELDTARAALDRVRRQLEEMTLVAPAEGIIIRRDGEIGQLVRPGEPVFWMACCDALRITAEIDEEDISEIKPGQKAVIRADAFPGRVFEGVVDAITPKGDPVARSFRVRIGLPQGTPLRIGMTADCNIILRERRDALLVSATAIVDGGVWLVRDGALVRRSVKTGVSGERMVEVTAGLDEHDLVVSRPGTGLREGRAVRLVRARTP